MLSVRLSFVCHNSVTNEGNLMKLMQNIYDHSVVMHVKFNQDVISYYRGCIAL